MQLSSMTDAADYFSCCCLLVCRGLKAGIENSDKLIKPPVLLCSLIHHYKDSRASLRPEISYFLYMKSVMIVISFQLEYYFSFFFFFAV